MTKYIVRSWILLLHFDCLMRCRGFEAVNKAVRAEKLGERRLAEISEQMLTRAVDIACVLYFKPVLCLQRSAALAVLLRRCGYYGELVIGAQLVPFQSHAWVEITDRIVNDKPSIRETFQVLDRW